MKVYRKDRLYANDKDKTESLAEVLKNVRITDEALYFNNLKNSSERANSPPHSPNVGYRGNNPPKGGGGSQGGNNYGGAGGGSFTGGAKNTFTPSGDTKQRGASGHTNASTSDYQSQQKQA